MRQVWARRDDEQVMCAAGLGAGDAELRGEAEAEIAQLEAQLPQLEAAVMALLVPPQPADNRDVILEVSIACQVQNSL